MFMNSVFIASGNRIDPEEERDPPPDATPIRFPVYENAENTAWSASSPPPALQSLFARVLRPNDISPKHVEALNIKVESPCSPDELLPPKPDGQSYLAWDNTAQSADTVSYADATKSDPTAERKRKDFNDRLAELRIDNDTGYRVITKSPKDGVQLPRLAAMRRFWEALENMSQYWDSSLDQYYEAACADNDSGQNPKRQRLDSGTDRSSPLPDSKKPSPSPCETAGTDQQEANPTVEPGQNRRYKGRRTNNGPQMPEQFRVDAVRAFVEGVVWPFQATLAPPRQMPIVQIDKLNLPVRQTSAGYKVPEDRNRARQGYHQGPIFTIQVRGDTNFDANGKCDAVARLDLMREVGGLLQIAQERRRESKKEVKPGEGKWWTTKPRWGGGPGGEVENNTGNADVLRMAEEMIGARPSLKDRTSSGIMRSSKRKTPLMLWKEVRCGSGIWDPRTEYKSIGKDPSSEYDEVFMISSLNHHISVLKLTVHSAYVEYVLTAEQPDPYPDDPNWSSPRLQRTQWFDLFNVDHRVQLFRLLWGVMAYMTRGPEHPRLDLRTMSMD